MKLRSDVMEVVSDPSCCSAGRTREQSTTQTANRERFAVEAAAGDFRGSVAGDLRAENLARFHDRLESLHQWLRGADEYEIMKTWISIRVTGDGKAIY